MAEMRTDGNNCFVCGPSNDIGLKLNFRIEDDVASKRLGWIVIIDDHEM